MRRGFAGRRGRAIGLLALILAVWFGLGRWQERARWGRQETITQRAGEPAHVWRQLRPVWTLRLASNGVQWQSVQSLRLGDKRTLYYSGESELGCVERASGRLRWRFWLKPLAAPVNPEADWDISEGKAALYACETQRYAGYTPLPATCRLIALDKRTGKRLWERKLSALPLHAPCETGNLLLLPSVDGTVKALQRETGTLVWLRRFTATVPQNQYTEFTMRLQIENGVCLLKIGDGRLLGFRPENGKRLWSRQAAGMSVTASEYGAQTAFVCRKGIVYGWLGTEAVALQAGTGQLLWRRSSRRRQWFPDEFTLLEDQLLCMPHQTLTALREDTGETVWWRNAPDGRLSRSENEREDSTTLPPLSRLIVPSALAADSSQASVDKQADSAKQTDGGFTESLYAIASCPPLLKGQASPLLSAPALDTLLALDPKTGRERWRWQPENGMTLTQFLPDGDRAYVSDGFHITAMAEGKLDPLPTDAGERGDLARRMEHALFAWPPLPPENWLARLVHRTGWKWMIRNAPSPEAPSEQEAKMTLLRLGADSVPRLMEVVRHLAAQGDDPASRIFDYHSAITVALNLLLDLGDASVVPDLNQELAVASDTGTRAELAEALIQFGDTRSLGPLWQYAQKDGEGVETRESALRFVCHRAASHAEAITAASSARPAVSVPNQTAVTAYLQSQLINRKAPFWLRQLAKLELLNNRGVAARQLALSHFSQEHTTRFAPAQGKAGVLFYPGQPFGTLQGDSDWPGYGGAVERRAITQDEHGLWWLAFTGSYFGTEQELWFARSQDGTHWEHPVFAATLVNTWKPGRDYELAAFACRNGVLSTRWKTTGTEAAAPMETQPQVHLTCRIIDLYRDSDGDGITDLIETQFGLNPYNPDTNGNGLPDDVDKNPLYRPHKLTEEEAIYAAVIEGLCQTGRRLPDSLVKDYQDGPMPFGETRRPLLLLTPDSRGVEILGHAGTVICRPLRLGSVAKTEKAEQKADGRIAPFLMKFVPPAIDMEGAWRGITLWTLSHAPDEPFLPPGAVTAPLPDAEQEATTRTGFKTFHDFFPVQLSADGSRARVGYQLGGDNNPWESYLSTYDIEVRKTAGRWLPVECRQTRQETRHNSMQAVAPLPADRFTICGSSTRKP